MDLHLHNSRPRPDTVTYLAVPLIDDAVNSAIAIVVAGVDSAAIGGLFAILAAPVPVAVAVATATASVSLGHTYHRRGQACLESGRVEVKTAKAPKI